MSELKVNTISEVTGANGVVIDSVKLKDGEVYATKIQYTDGDDAITIADGGGITVAQAATFSSTIGSGNITSTGTIQGTSITATTAFVPDASDGAALGTTALEFSDLFLADAAVIALGDDQDVTLTHVADTGILLNSTNVIQFNDASQNIGAPSATVLDINATDEIELNATLVDINANVEISGTATTTGVHTFTAVPVFPNNTIETADIQADAITAAKIADNAINSEHYTDGSIDTAHIADNQVTLAKLAGGTDGNIISFDASGDPVAIATGSDGQVLTSTGAGSPPAFEAAPTISSQIISVSYDIATANGNLAITGVGFSPQTVVAFQTISNTPKWSFGMGTRPDNDYHCTVNNYLNNADNAADESNLVSVYTSADPNRAQAAIGSWDSDGITLAWTKTGSPTGTAVINLMFYK